MVKIVSWNINGIRGKSMDLFQGTPKNRTFNTESHLGKFVENFQPDILCLNETKCQDEHTESFNCLPYKNKFWNCSNGRKGYSGVAILTDLDCKLIGSIPNLSDEDLEGRSLIVEFNNFILVSVYTPNSGARREYRKDEWDPQVYQFLENHINNDKPLIYCGDLNVVHQEIDIHDPKTYRDAKLPGVLINEREAMNKYLELGYIDVWRILYPVHNVYSWWNPRVRGRERNIGWRLDYFLIHKIYQNIVINSTIHNEIMGSDHCPISLEIDI